MQAQAPPRAALCEALQQTLVDLAALAKPHQASALEHLWADLHERSPLSR